MKDSVLLDTSFFIRLLNEEDKLHKNALGYFKRYLERDITLKCSTISIAEYCVKGKFDELPWRNIQALPFNVDHGIRAGEFARLVFAEKNNLKTSNRNIIPNDSKLFAQADLDSTITRFVTSDQECQKVFKIIKNHVNLKFEIIDIHTPFHDNYGELDFGE